MEHIRRGCNAQRSTCASTGWVEFECLQEIEKRMILRGDDSCILVTSPSITCACPSSRTPSPLPLSPTQMYPASKPVPGRALRKVIVSIEVASSLESRRSGLNRVLARPIQQHGKSGSTSKRTSQFNQTSKEDIAHSAINHWVQAMTSVETANEGKFFIIEGFYSKHGWFCWTSRWWEVGDLPVSGRKEEIVMTQI